ncbi:AI-2E family transporter [Mesobaculum littorinae]|uniref:AI-2E family transporter n=2 Tax=Mesobaculum littorinae TaxID=2486419 RepID=A0A438ALI7_9RHOB|nr:AI-2E family transporter [Mesobaculum littorinae]RVV99406.1 AI-2E family transporter [Mesobaculum littorinae]
MPLSMHNQAKYWGIAAAVFLLLLWWMGDVILPFILGGAIAYILDPIADRIEKMGASRALATTLITLFAVLLFVLLALLVIPTLISQTTQLINAIPDIATNLQGFLTERFPEVVEPESTIRRSLASVGETLQSRGGELLNTLLASVSGLVNVITLFVIVPVVSFYLLLDWDKMVAKLDGLLPRDHAPTIRQLAQDIDHTMAGFIRGQGLVCLIVGVYYSVALMAVGLQFGLVVGAIAGFLTFIPYVGALVGGGLAIGLALFQFWGDWVWIIAVWAIFQSGQFVEGNFLTPKLVGDSIGLHPVWLLFALAAFGALFGFVGLLVAVPVAAALGVLARFATARYKESSLYRGEDPFGGPTPGL